MRTRRFIRTLAVFAPLFAALALLAAGCGGASSTSRLLTIQILSITPANGATGVPITAITIRARADRPLDWTTVTPSNVYVTEAVGGTVVQGNVVYDPATYGIVWTLTQTDLNTFFPGQTVFAYNASYTFHLDQGLRSQRQEPMGRARSATFTTQGLGYSPVVAECDPQPNTTTALIDPFYRLVNGVLTEVTLQFKINVPLDGATVTSGNVYLRETGSVASILGTTTFDTATNTICWVPTGTGDPNPNYPGEPLLKLATQYDFVVTKNVKPTGGVTPPTTDLVIPFVTTSIAIRTPVQIASGGTGDLVLNEVLADPNPSSLATGDSNGDGVATSYEDEFVEIVNVSTDYIDLTGLRVWDSSISSASNRLYTFPSTIGSVHRNLVAPGRVVVVFAGGTPSASRKTIGRSKVHAGTRSQGLFQSSDAVIVLGPTSTSDLRMTTNFSGAPYGASLTRNPDVTGTLTTDHSSITPGTNFSPGRKVNGGLFP